MTVRSGAHRSLADGWHRLVRMVLPEDASGTVAPAGPVVALTVGGGEASGTPPGGPIRFRPVLGPRPAPGPNVERAASPTAPENTPGHGVTAAPANHLGATAPSPFDDDPRDDDSPAVEDRPSGSLEVRDATALPDPDERAGTGDAGELPTVPVTVPAPPAATRFGAPANPATRLRTNDAAPSFGYRPPPLAPPATQPPAPAPGFGDPGDTPRGNVFDRAHAAAIAAPRPSPAMEHDAEHGEGTTANVPDVDRAAPRASEMTTTHAPASVASGPASSAPADGPERLGDPGPAAAPRGPVADPARPRGTTEGSADPIAPAAPSVQPAESAESAPLPPTPVGHAPATLPVTVLAAMPRAATAPSRRVVLDRWLARHLSVPGLLVALAVIVGMPMRLLWLATIPPGLNQDEAVSGYDAWSIFQTGRDHHGHPISLAGLESFGDWSSPLLTFLTVPFVGVFGLHLGTIRLVAALLGLAVIPGLYALGRELTGQRAIGVVAAWIVALLPIAIHISRWAIPPTTVPLLVPLTMLALVWALRRRSGGGLILAAAVGGIAVAGYPSLKVYLPLLAAAIVVIYLPDLLVMIRRAPLQVIVALVVVVITAGPVLWMGSRDPGGRARADQVSALNAPDFGIRQLFDAYRSYFSPGFLFTHGDGDPMHSPSGFGILPPVLLPFMLIGLIALVARVLAPQGVGNRQRSLVILAATALVPFPGALTLPSPHTLRALQIVPMAALLAAIGAVALVRLIATALDARRSASGRLAMAIVIAATVGVAGLQLRDQYRNYLVAYPDQIAGSFQDGGLQVAGYVYDQRKDYDRIYFTGLNQTYIYLLFAGPWDADDVHNNLQVRRHPPSFNDVTGIDNVSFADAPPSITRAGGHEVYRLRTRGGTTWVATAYTDPNGARVLVVRPG